jgi:hypothetical protein
MTLNPLQMNELPVLQEYAGGVASGLLIYMATGYGTNREAGETDFSASRKWARAAAIGPESPEIVVREPKKTA